MNIMAQCDHSHLNKMEAERRAEMNKLYDFNIDMKLRLFYVLVWTACITNTLGIVTTALFLSDKWRIAGTGLLVLFAGAFIVWRLHSSELLARLYSTMKICSSSCLISQECL